MRASRGVSEDTAHRKKSKIPRSVYNFSDSDSEMSYKDRGGSPILLESGLKSFLGHPGHNFPLLNGMSFVVPPKEHHQRMEYQLPAAAAPTPLGHQVPVGVMQGTLTHVQAPPPPPPQQQQPQQQQQQHPQHPAGAAGATQDEQHRWAQYQIWRQHVYINGNSKPAHPHSHGHSTIKDLAGGILGDDKSKDDGELWNAVEAQTAFLGPNLWDKTYETDLKYVDLDEFLSENGVSMDGLGTHGSLGPLATSQSLPKRERSPSPIDCMSPDTMNPPSPADSNEELKPQPLIKKSRKQFVPENLKDDKYWARRRKNNLAAKRSRDARRLKENQIAMRAGYLEKENVGLRQELERLKKENLMLQNKLAKYEDV